MAMVFGVFLIGCETEPDDPTYKVWIGTFDFSTVTTDDYWGNLEDGQYKRGVIINDSGFEWERSHNFKDSPENIWTKDQIYSYFIGLGFSSNIAKQESEWLISINHGAVGSRKGESLNMILK